MPWFAATTTAWEVGGCCTGGVGTVEGDDGPEEALGAPFPLFTTGPIVGTVVGDDDEEVFPLLDPRVGTGRATDGWCWVTPGREWLWR